MPTEFKRAPADPVVRSIHYLCTHHPMRAGEVEVEVVRLPLVQEALHERPAYELRLELWPQHHHGIRRQRRIDRTHPHAVLHRLEHQHRLPPPIAIEPFSRVWE